jgi:hypothetical protein
MAGFHTKTFLKHDDYMTPKYAWEDIKHIIPKDKELNRSYIGIEMDKVFFDKAVERIEE